MPEQTESPPSAPLDELAALRSEVESLKRQMLIPDLISTLRNMRSYLLGQGENLSADLAGEHGHALLIRLLSHEARFDDLAGRTLIEIGTTRERDHAQCSTEKLAICTSLLAMRFVTVDIDPSNAREAKKSISLLNPHATAIVQSGEDYLAGVSGALEYVYLDAFDFDHGKHSQTRKDRYRELLNVDITNEACWRMHLRCAEAIAPKMRDGGIVVIDDTWTAPDGTLIGKGKLAVPLLLESGFHVVARTKMAIGLRKSSTAEPADPAVDDSSRYS